HSLNLMDRPRVEFVIFNTQAAPATAGAVYCGAVAAKIPPEELPLACAEAFARVREGAHAFTPEDLSGAAPLRLFRAEVDQGETHVRGGDPVWGTGVDTRLAVHL